MKQAESIKAFNQYLSSSLAAEFRTSGNEDEWPLPVVFVDDFTLEDLNVHNSSFAGEVHNGDSIDRYHLYYFDLTLELVVRDNDDVDAWTALDELRAALRPFEEAPQELHDHVSKVSLGTAGEVTHQFAEPKETEINQSVELRAFEVRVESRTDLIESINDQFNIQ